VSWDDKGGGSIVTDNGDGGSREGGSEGEDGRSVSGVSGSKYRLVFRSELALRRNEKEVGESSLRAESEDGRLFV
jgi:hypothetical protein